tara:strand:- start:3436 stop:3891 length:456 start_codon:yes stop_codon:yes gene_type:complete
MHTFMNRKNLKKLADYLAALPQDYTEFDMTCYASDGLSPYETHHTCGTVGCAIGHGPKVKGLEALPEEGWTGYIKRVCGFEEESREYDWVFDGFWSDVDNTTTGAALRIYTLLDSGVPEGFTHLSLEIGDESLDVFGLVEHYYAAYDKEQQ